MINSCYNAAIIWNGSPAYLLLLITNRLLEMVLVNQKNIPNIQNEEGKGEKAF